MLSKAFDPGCKGAAETDQGARKRCDAIVGRGGHPPVGPQAKDAVPALILELSDPDPAYRQEVVYALAAIGPESKAGLRQRRYSILTDAKEDSKVRCTRLATPWEKSVRGRQKPYLRCGRTWSATTNS